MAEAFSLQFRNCVMRAVVLASVGALAVCVTLPTLAAEQNAALNLRSDQSYSAKWDRCEALARKRGTPPGKIGYGDFIDDCARNTPPNQARMAVRRGRLGG
jgi:hypothetical protein